jgi:hypothetical protein
LNQSRKVKKEKLVSPGTPKKKRKPEMDLLGQRAKHN